MTASSSSTCNSTSRFIICIQNAHGGWERVGFVIRGKKNNKPDDAIKNRFRMYTRGYETVLKSCRWLDGPNNKATSVDWEWRYAKYRTAKL